jgi:CheY-like chemotaxis protein
MLDHFLCSQGFSVATASGGDAAIKLAVSEPFDAVVLDYEMPGMNGEEVARRLKQINPRLPIVLFSASISDLPEPVVKLTDAAIRKGNSLTDLTDALHRLTGGRRERRRQRRRALSAEIDILAQDEFTGRVRTRLADLSAGGIGVAEPLEVAPGQLVELEIAIVRYKAGARTGLEFVQIDEQQRRAIEIFCTAAASGTSASG